MNTFRQRWQTFTRREQGLLLGGACVFLGALYFLLVHEPLVARVARAQVHAGEARETLAWLQALPARSPASEPVVGRLDSRQALLACVNDTARAAGLEGALRRVAPTGERRFEVALEDASFESVIAWLVGLRRTQQMAIAQAQFDRTEKTGVVRVALVLEFP